MAPDVRQRSTMRNLPFVVLLGTLAAGLSAQNRTVLPPVCANLPGNAALSMPLRWSVGTLQVRIDAALLPASLQGRTLQSIRLRRPTFLREPAYPAVQRMITVRGGFQADTPGQILQGLQQNRPATLVTVFGPAVVSVPATPAVGAGTSTGPEFLHLPFSTPLPMQAGTLFLEFETTSTPFVVDADNWVDGFWFTNGAETGYVASLGNGSCTSRPVPLELQWAGGAGPTTGSTARLQLQGAVPSGFVFAWFGLAPDTRPVAANYFGFGGSLAALDPGLQGCHQWAPMDAMWGAFADSVGAYMMEFSLASGFATTGVRIGVQVAALDPGRPGLPLSFSNGVALVVNSTSVGGRCASVYFPGTATTSPWLPFYGQMPVLVLGHD